MLTETPAVAASEPATSGSQPPPASLASASSSAEARRPPRLGLGATAGIIAAVAVGGYVLVSRMRTPVIPPADARQVRATTAPVTVASPPAATIAPPALLIVDAAVALSGPPPVTTAPSEVDAGFRLWRPSPRERDEALQRIQAGLSVCTLQFGSYGRHARLDVTYDGTTGAAVTVLMHGPNYPRAALRQCIEQQVRTVQFAAFNQPRWLTAYTLDVP